MPFARRTSRRSIAVVAGAFVATSLAVSPTGCGPSTATVSGNVTLDGQPVSSGVISFVASEGSASPVTTEIREGEYSATMERGKKLVQVSAPIVVGQQPEHRGSGAPMVDITRESVPPRYNSQSELTLDVSGSLQKDWALEGALK